MRGVGGQLMTPDRQGNPRGGVCQRLSLAAVALIRSLRAATTVRSVTDLGDHQLRDIGLSRLDCARSLACAEGGLITYGALGMFPARDARFLPVGSTDRPSVRFPTSRYELRVLPASPRP